jgi:hypothetical protein
MNHMPKTTLKSLPKFKFYHFVFIFALLSGPALAQQSTCTVHPWVIIQAPNDSMISDICNASSRAISFLAKYNLQPKRDIKFQVIETVINSHGYLAYGCYDRQKDIIQIMSFPSIKSNSKSPKMYDQPFDKEHYHGAIAHEIAHDIFHHNTGNIKEQLTNVAQEYVAHSTQMGVLSTERRNEIIETTDVGAWEPGDSISVTYMALRPTAFAVKSYQHLTQMVDPQSFIKLLLINNWFYISVP